MHHVAAFVREITLSILVTEPEKNGGDPLVGIHGNEGLPSRLALPRELIIVIIMLKGGYLHQ